MTKLARYLKPFVVPILVVIGLLFMQAYCELTLPDYMQNIVNIGIQNNGIEHGVYEQVRESTLEPFLMVATEDQKELIEIHIHLLHQMKQVNYSLMRFQS